MGTELLLTGLFILFVLGLLVAFIVSMVFIFNAKKYEAVAKDAPGERRFFAASLMNFLNQK